MKVWNPINNKKFETLSYLPPLSDDSIAKEIDYMLKKGWIPCLEFDEVGYVYRENSQMPGIMMGDTGHCGSCPCLVVLIRRSFSMKSSSAKQNTRMLIFAAWHSTTSTRVSAWPLSFRSQQLPPPLPPPPPPLTLNGKIRL